MILYALYRVKNVWDPRGREQWYAEHAESQAVLYGTGNAANIRVRSLPNLDGKHLGYVQKDERVEILEITDEKMQIGEWNDYWYKVKKSDGLIGWAFGYFIDLEE